MPPTPPPPDGPSGPAAVPAPVTLVVGPERVLVERAVALVLAQARALDPATERRDLDAADEDAAPQVVEVLSPTLFGDAAVVVVAGSDQADTAVCAALVEAARDLPAGVRLVLLHPGGARNKRLLDDLRAVGAVEVPCPEIRKGKETVDFLAREVSRHGRRATREALTTLYDAIGHDLALLASAVAQLAVDIEHDPIDAADVRCYFGGVAEVTGFQIADAVWERRPVDALRNLRWAADAGDRARLGPATVGAVSAGLRSLVRYAGVPRGVAEARVAAEVGVKPWRLRALRGQLARWHPEQLARAVVRLAATDAAVKGGLREGENLDVAQKLLALERLVVDVAAYPGQATPQAPDRPTGRA